MWDYKVSVNPYLQVRSIQNLDLYKAFLQISLEEVSKKILVEINTHKEYCGSDTSSHD